MLVRRCAKPDKNEFSKIAMATGAGFAIMGFIGFFVKLMCVIILPFTLQCYDLPDVVPSAGTSFVSRQSFKDFIAMCASGVECSPGNQASGVQTFFRLRR